MSSISIKVLVLEYLNSKDEGNDRFRRLFRIATLQGMRKFNMDITGQFKTQLLPISANHTVPFPDDYLDYVMVGIINSDGEGVPLRHNEDIIPIKRAFLTATDSIVGSPTIPGFTNQLDSIGNPLFWLNYQWGNSFYNLYGLAGGQPRFGDFTVDDNAKCFLISPDFQYTAILVEYLTNGYDCDTGQYMIHTFAADAFTAWLRWQDNIDKKGVSAGEKNNLRLDFAREKKMAKLRLNPVRIAEMQKVFRYHTKLTARA
jgi:hypothetical protein